jgi:hypothetical protein
MEMIDCQPIRSEIDDSRYQDSGDDLYDQRKPEYGLVLIIFFLYPVSGKEILQ